MCLRFFVFSFTYGRTVLFIYLNSVLGHALRSTPVKRYVQCTLARSNNIFTHILASPFVRSRIKHSYFGCNLTFRPLEFRWSAHTCWLFNERVYFRISKNNIMKTVYWLIRCEEYLYEASILSWQSKLNFDFWQPNKSSKDDNLYVTFVACVWLINDEMNQE